MTKIYDVTITQGEYSMVMESLKRTLQKYKRRQQVSTGTELDKWLDAEYAIDKLVVAMRAAKSREMTDEFREARLAASEAVMEEVAND